MLQKCSLSRAHIYPPQHQPPAGFGKVLNKDGAQFVQTEIINLGLFTAKC